MAFGEVTKIEAGHASIILDDGRRIGYSLGVAQTRGRPLYEGDRVSVYYDHDNQEPTNVVPLVIEWRQAHADRAVADLLARLRMER